VFEITLSIGAKAVAQNPADTLLIEHSGYERIRSDVQDRTQRIGIAGNNSKDNNDPNGTGHVCAPHGDKSIVF
jgi:hypothetical protein